MCCSLSLVYSQCQDCSMIEENNTYWRDATYQGCLNDSDIPHGKGIYKDYQTIYNGCFKNGKMDGEGVMTIEDKNGQRSISQRGFFVKNNFDSGIETIIYNNNMIYISEYKNGIILNTKNNFTNYYSSEDIETFDQGSNLDYTIIKPERRDNHFWISMRVNDSAGEWIFDTGGDGLSIGKKLWARMQKEGVVYKDLNIESQTEGVGGFSNVKFVLLEEVVIGEFIVKNVVARVRYDQNYSLMGAEFYDKFSNVIWNMQKEEIIFYK